MHHLIAVLDSMCIHLCCVILVRDRMVWNIIWWNHFGCWMVQPVPIATSLLYENHSEFGAEHALVGAYVSWGFFWVFLGPRFLLLLTEVQQAVLGLPRSCSTCCSSAWVMLVCGPCQCWWRSLWPGWEKGLTCAIKIWVWQRLKTSEVQKRAVLKKICITNGAPCAREKEYAVIKE